MSATTVEPDPRLPVGEASSRLAMPGWRSMRRLVREPLAIVALLILLALLITGALAHQIAPEGWNSIDVSGQWLNHAPTFTANHLLGTDNIGRDVGWRPPEHSS